jgi:branched-chain amino acid transport system ATP-binding protein
MPYRELRAEGVSVVFGKVKALDSISVAFRPGALVGVMGPNGAGKTTLLNILSGAVQPSSGQVWLADRRIDGLPPWHRPAVGITRTFQRCELVAELSVVENVLIGAHHQIRLMAELFGRTRTVKARTERWLDRFGIDRDLWEAPVGTLPYGWQRRVEIVRALVAEPAYLLLDEPVAGMDRSESQELGALIQNWVRETGGGAILVEHDVDLVAAVCDEVHVLDFGELIVSGPPATALRHPQVIEAYLGAGAVG